VPTARVDLHCHSTASDGEYPPAEVARRAQAAGLAAIALTDHDTTSGVPEATRAGEALGVRVVSGCEFSVKAPWGELHLLGYFLPPGHARLEEFLAGTRAARQRRAEQIVAHLHRLGVAIEVGDIVRAANGGALGRPHVARVLVQRGVCVDMNEAFARYLGRGRPAYVEKPLPTLQQVARWSTPSAGLPSRPTSVTTAPKARSDSSRSRVSTASRCGTRAIRRAPSGGSPASPSGSAWPSVAARIGTATWSSGILMRRSAGRISRWNGSKSSKSVARRRQVRTLYKSRRGIS